MILTIIGIAVSLFAALFAYLSWRKAVLIDIYRREEHLRNRLTNPPLGFVSPYFIFEAFRIRVFEEGKRRYRLKKYSPIGEVEGQTQVTLRFHAGDARPMLMDEEYRQRMRDEGIYYADDRDVNEVLGVDPLVEGSDTNITVVVDTLDPSEVEIRLVKFRSLLREYGDENLDPLTESERDRETERE